MTDEELREILASEWKGLGFTGLPDDPGAGMWVKPALSAMREVERRSGGGGETVAVPLVPTDAMKAAGRQSLLETQQNGLQFAAVRCYRAMVKEFKPEAGWLAKDMDKADARVAENFTSEGALDSVRVAAEEALSGMPFDGLDVVRGEVIAQIATAALEAALASTHLPSVEPAEIAAIRESGCKFCDDGWDRYPERPAFHSNGIAQWPCTRATLLLALSTAREEERERCAKVADAFDGVIGNFSYRIASAIRKLGETE